MTAVGALERPPVSLTSPRTGVVCVDVDCVNHWMQLAAAADARGVLREATQTITRLLGERGSCILLEGGPRVLLAPHAPGVVDWPIDLGKYPEIVQASTKREVVWIDDARADARLAGVREGLPRELRSVAVIPMSIGDRCAGVFLVQSARCRTPAPAALETAALIGRIAAVLWARSEQIATCPPDEGQLSLAADTGLGRRVLVIEDDGAQSAALSEALTYEGYVVACAADGAEGLQQALANPPDLVLLDVNLPRLDGFQTAAGLRREAATRDLPILFLSASDDLPRRLRDVRFEEVDFLPKPFSFEELLTRMQRALSQAKGRRQLRLEAERDELTGLGNLRMLRARMITERARFERYGDPLSVAVMDVDKLKRINDQHGHLAGSRALQAVADVLRRDVRETDLPVRYGGDEFIVLLPHTTLDEARVFADRALAHIAEAQPDGVAVTVSIGLASLRRGPDVETDDEFLRRADEAAYRAKRDGGNRVCTETTSVEAEPGPS